MSDYVSMVTSKVISNFFYKCFKKVQFDTLLDYSLIKLLVNNSVP
jgi:hypothetical protein